jgi:hypothetical protein
MIKNSVTLCLRGERLYQTSIRVQKEKHYDN